MELLEQDAALRRQTLYSSELCARPWLHIDSTKVAKPIRQPILPKPWSNLEQLERAEQRIRRPLTQLPTYGHQHRLRRLPHPDVLLNVLASHH
jgi:hypothetical protein